MVSKIRLECLLLICVYTYAKFIVICKPRTLNDGGEDSVIASAISSTEIAKSTAS